MTKKTAKKLTPNYPIPQSKEEADDYIRQIGELRRDLARVEADMNDRLAEIKEEHEQAATPLRDKVEELVLGLETWCLANRDALTNGGKVKFATFNSGEVKWRSRPARVTIRGAAAVIEALKELGLSRFVRIKEDINKDAVLDDPEAVKAVKGLSVGSAGEDFAVEPFEIALNENEAA